MKLHPKIKMICEEFAQSYEWIANDGSLFIKASPEFVLIIKEKLETSPLELVSSKQRSNSYETLTNGYKSFTTSSAITTLWYRIPEEQEKSYDFDDEEDDE
jgi:hypothetical protein